MQIHFLKRTLPLVAPLLLAGACSNKKTGTAPAAAAPTTKDTLAVTPPVVQKGVVKDEVLQAVYLKYMEVNQALIDGNLTKARLASNALEAGAQQLPGGSKLASAAANITVASSLEAQRTYFATLSNEIIALVKGAGTRGGEIYVDYCPMALNDKGAYWLSTEKEIKNPYFGDVMLNCGEVKETIK